VLSNEEVRDLQTACNQGGTDRVAANTLIQQHADRGVSQIELSNALNLDPSTVWKIVNNKTGHETRPGDRGGSTPVKHRVTNLHKKSGSGASTRTQGTKGRPLNPEGEQTLLNAMGANFHATWSNPNRNALIPPASMDVRLAQTVADLRGEFTLASMSRYLGMSSDALRSFYNQYYATRVSDAPPQHAAPSHPAMQIDPPHETAVSEVRYNSQTGQTAYYDGHHGHWFAIPPDTTAQQPATTWGPVAESSRHAGQSSSNNRHHEEDDDPEPYEGKGTGRSNRQR
jgi:hypothetical protein